MRDLSLLLGTKKHQDNPDFLMQAEELGKVVTCFSCGKVIGAGVDQAAAEADAVENSTGAFMKGNWFCTTDSPSDGHPPVPTGLQKHKSPAARQSTARR